MLAVYVILSTIVIAHLWFIQLNVERVERLRTRYDLALSSVCVKKFNKEIGELADELTMFDIMVDPKLSQMFGDIVKAEIDKEERGNMLPLVKSLCGAYYGYAEHRWKYALIIIVCCVLLGTTLVNDLTINSDITWLQGVIALAFSSLMVTTINHIEMFIIINQADEQLTTYVEKTFGIRRPISSEND
jgi:hypothetical protein